MKVIVEITETLSKTIELECNSQDDALEFIKSRYDKEDIVLDSTDFIGVECKVLKKD